MLNDNPAEKYADLIDSFVTEVASKRGGFEPNDNYCWMSVAAGFALARGYSQDDAFKFAVHLMSIGVAS